MNISRIALLAALFCALVTVLHAQSLLFRDYSTRDGLPDSRIAPILQDHRGYLWLGAQAGLARYDGHEFVTFGPAHDIPGIFGRSIMEDRFGAIWFACSGFRAGRVTRYWSDSVLTIDHSNGLKGLQPFDVVDGMKNDVWVGTDAGIEWIRFLDSARSRWTVDTWRDTSLMALYRTRNGVLYFADGNGLFKVVDEHPVCVFATGRNDWRWHVRPYSFFEQPDGELLFGGFHEAYLLRNDTVWRFGSANGVPRGGVWCFQEDVDGSLYAGTMDGLYRVALSRSGPGFIKVPSFGDAIIYDMCLDAEGNLWLASSPGLRRLLRIAEVVPFRRSADLAHVGLGPLAFDGNGSLYLGSRNSGVYVLNGENLSHMVPPQPFSGRTVSALLPRSNGDVFVGLWRGGLLLRHSDRMTVYTVRDGLPSDNVHALEESHRIIVGTAAGLATIESEGVMRMVRTDAGEPTVFDITKGRDDTIWVGTSDGVNVYRDEPDSLDQVAPPLSVRPLSGMNVNVVFRDAESRIWFGTDGHGAFCTVGDSLEHFGRDDGLIGDRIFAIAQDSLRHIWFGTSTGLSCYDGRCFRSLGYAEGFGEIGMHGIAVEKDGSLWVSTYPGLTHLEPSPFFRSDAPRPLYLTATLVDGKPASSQTGIVLQPGAAVISFHFAALSFSDERNVRYRYKLEGFDRDWSAPTASREVRYTHLPPGSYTFAVIARTGDGVWSVRPVQESFVILPPVWARWWFLMSSGLAIVLGIYALYRYRLAKMLEIERTRSRIAMDLHDDIGSTLTRISVMTEVAKRQSPEDAPVQAYLGRIGDTSRDLIESLSDIVWSVDPRHDTLQDVVRRIVEFGQEVCDGRSVIFETDLHGSFDAVRLTLERRRDIYLFFKEGLNNIVRHSKATHARVRLQPTERGALIELLDDGIGLPPEPDTDRHGLTSLKERGQRAGIACTIESTPGEGTKISLEIKTA